MREKKENTEKMMASEANECYSESYHRGVRITVTMVPRKLNPTHKKVTDTSSQGSHLISRKSQKLEQVENSPTEFLSSLTSKCSLPLSLMSGSVANFYNSTWDKVCVATMMFTTLHFKFAII